MNRYLVCIELRFTSGKVRNHAVAYSISEKTEVEDLIYSDRTIAFFIVNSNESKEDVLVKVNNIFESSNSTAYIAINMDGINIEDKTIYAIKGLGNFEILSFVPGYKLVEVE